MRNKNGKLKKATYVDLEDSYYLFFRLEFRIILNKLIDTINSVISLNNNFYQKNLLL